MGFEMKTQENSENSFRNRKKKENTQEKSEQSLKNSSKSSEKTETESAKKVFQEENSRENGDVKTKREVEAKCLQEDSSEALTREEGNSSVFRIRLELDPMSIALFLLAIVTRFFKLSEPRNVV